MVWQWVKLLHKCEYLLELSGFTNALIICCGYSYSTQMLTSFCYFKGYLICILHTPKASVLICTCKWTRVKTLEVNIRLENFESFKIQIHLLERVVFCLLLSFLFVSTCCSFCSFVFCVFLLLFSL